MLKAMIAGERSSINTKQVSQVTFFSSAIVSPIKLNLDLPRLAVLPEDLADGISSTPRVLSYFPVESMNPTTRAVFIELQSLGIIPSVLGGRICPFLALGTGKVDNYSGFSLSSHIYSIMRLKVPAPTVLPPSRIAKRSPLSSATG